MNSQATKVLILFLACTIILHLLRALLITLILLMALLITLIMDERYMGCSIKIQINSSVTGIRT